MTHERYDESGRVLDLTVEERKRFKGFVPTEPKQ